MSDHGMPAQTLNQMLTGGWVTQAIYVAAELGIADLLVDEPQTVAALAAGTQTHAESLRRILRALASVGIFAEDGEGRYMLTPLADRLRSDAPQSQRHFARMQGSEMYMSWGNLLSSARTGKPAFDETFGKPVFAYLTEHDERGHMFDAAMTGVHSAETGPMLDAYDFSDVETVVDVGGGAGQMLAELLKRHPSVRGVLFDLPAAAERGRTTMTDEGLSDRCAIAGGDFFAAVPGGGDVYMLRHILHDWDDTQAVSILRNCRDAMNPGGRILVIESVIPPGNDPCFGKWLDLMMLVVGGRERTREEYEALFAQAGLRLNRIVPTAHEVSLVEAVRKN